MCSHPKTRHGGLYSTRTSLTRSCSAPAALITGRGAGGPSVSAGVARRRAEEAAAAAGGLAPSTFRLPPGAPAAEGAGGDVDAGADMVLLASGFGAGPAVRR